VVNDDVGVPDLLMAIHRGVRSYLWYWAIMVVVAVVLVLIFGGSFGVILLGVVFVTFLLLVAYMFIELWLDLKRRGDLDRHLSRAVEISNGDLSEDADAKLEHLLPLLVAAGFAQIDGASPVGYRLIPEAVRRQRALGSSE
jgi:hypothetical protein